MAKKPTVTTVASGYYGRTALNNNFTALRDGFDNTLSLDGSTPNAMGADLDMNSNDILNVNDTRTARLFVNGVQVSSTALVNDATVAEVDTVALLVADTNLTYTTGQTRTVAVGDYVRTVDEGFVYEVAASGATDHHVTTAGGVKLYVQPSESGYDLRAFGAVGDGTTNDTAAIQAACTAIVSGDWIDGNSQTYRVVSQVTASGTFFKLRNAKFVTTTNYASQGYFTITSKFVDLDVEVDGGRDTYKTGTEPWTVFESEGGYDSIEPDITDFFSITNYSDGTDAVVRVNLKMVNMFCRTAITIRTYGTAYVDGYWKNCANKTFQVYHSADNGVTVNGRTYAGTIFQENIGKVPANFTIDGVAETRAGAEAAPQGSFGAIVTHGDYYLDQLYTKNYCSCAVTSDRNGVFQYNSIHIEHDDGDMWSNNPSGAFWLENTRIVKGGSLTVKVMDRDARDYSLSLDSSALQIYADQANYDIDLGTVFVETVAATGVLNKAIRGSFRGTGRCVLQHYGFIGTVRGNDAAHSFASLGSTAVAARVHIKGGYANSGTIRGSSMHTFTVSDMEIGGAVVVNDSSNPDITGNMVNFTVKGCSVSGGIRNDGVLIGKMLVLDNPQITGNVAGGTCQGQFSVTNNAAIVGNISVSSPVAVVSVCNNQVITGTTIVSFAKNASIQNNGTRRRIEIKDVQIFNVSNNDAKTDQAENIIWVNPVTASNVLAGVISGNNVLIKTGTTGAGTVTIAGGVSGVTDTDNNKLTVAWT